jgi:hypothetical protein
VYKSGSAFSQHFFETTVADVLSRRLGWFSQTLDDRAVFRNTTLFEMRNLPETRKLKGPVFVYAHILLPHDPFVFEADGGIVTREEQAQRSFTQNFVNHLRYANKRLDGLLDRLMSGPAERRPIILLTADEGPHMVTRPGLTWSTATRTELLRHFTILAAYYTPGVDARKVLYPSVSPVNSFRALANLYFDAKLPLLPDKHMGWTADHGPKNYRFFDVSDRLGTDCSRP